MHEIEKDIRAQRAQIDKLFDEPQRGVNVFEAIGELEGITIVERTDLENYNYKCSAFAFGKVKGEPWAFDTSTGKHPLWRDTLKFLEEKGYQEVDEPQNGDIVGYASDSKYSGDLSLVSDDRLERKPPYFKHFGVIKDGKVVSKFNSGYIYKHDEGMVPHRFGKQVYYFRKAEQE